MTKPLRIGVPLLIVACHFPHCLLFLSSSSRYNEGVNVSVTRVARKSSDELVNIKVSSSSLTRAQQQEERKDSSTTCSNVINGK
mmetsp:Transcript_28003/g.34080  ORF Transcript_28003/g.34080 Transcript_28003/m.34080 type:complete len:84 (-) Transcript_28003:8-259(-)